MALLGPLHLTNGSMLYLGAVIVVAVVAGRGPAIAASIGAFLVFNYLFTEPRFTFAVSDPDVVVALVSFLLVAIVTSQLAAGVRDRAELARMREREALLLHDLAALLATRPLPIATEAIAARLQSQLGLAAIGIALHAANDRTVVAGDAAALRTARAAPGSVAVLGPAPLADVDAPRRLGRWTRVASPHPPGAIIGPTRLLRVPIRASDGRAAGDLHVLLSESDERDVPEETARVVATVAGQLGIAAEQEGLRRQATETELLRRTDDLRRRLLDAVSHDLRTPLASIIAAAGSLQQTDVDWTDEDRRDFAAAIEQEAERLNRIVGNLLDLGRIQDGSLVPAREWRDPSTVLVDAVDRLRATLPGRAIELDVSPDLPAVLLDAVEIDQVIANLVENAARVAPAASPIRIGAEVVGGELRVTVEDAGPGLPPGPPDRLFEPFVRGAPGETGPGSGLGLAVARGLVTAHGGRIRAENRSEGGARFAFALPAPPMPAMEEG